MSDDPKATLEDLLREVYEANDHVLTAEAVVVAATPHTHPLHHRFTWDDKLGAHLNRLREASDLIRSVRVRFIRDEEEFKVRLFHCERDLGGATPGAYRSLDDIEGDPVAQQLLLRAMERDFISLKRRYAHMSAWVSLLRKELQEAG
jgi:hypothetical protein